MLRKRSEVQREGGAFGLVGSFIKALALCIWLHPLWSQLLRGSENIRAEYGTGVQGASVCSTVEECPW